jgi:hypothetical protein
MKPYIARLAIVLIWSITFGAPSAASADYASSVLNDGPIGYWRLGESAGLIAFDASPNNFNGTYVGNVTLGAPSAIATDTNTAANLDGVSGYVDVGAHAAINQLANDFTIEAWMKGKGPIASTWLVATPTREATGFAFSVPFDPKLGTNSPYDSVLRFTTFGIQDYDYPVEFAAGEWFHVAAVFDSSNDVTFFINGVNVAKVFGDAPARTNFQPFHIGEAAGGIFYFNGGIDEVAIYGRSLDAAEIREHYIASIPEPTTASLCLVACAALLCFRRCVA